MYAGVMASVEDFTIMEISHQLVRQVRLPLEKFTTTMVMKRIGRILIHLPLGLSFWDLDDDDDKELVACNRVSCRL